jgi:hypothetical protein
MLRFGFKTGEQKKEIKVSKNNLVNLLKKYNTLLNTSKA